MIQNNDPSPPGLAILSIQAFEDQEAESSAFIFYITIKVNFKRFSQCCVTAGICKKTENLGIGRSRNVLSIAIDS